ncbi:MAG: c-type cytochrome, partial [Candidatus Acidiferrales bacterium]
MSLALMIAPALFLLPALRAQSTRFHDAPASADEMKNPYAGEGSASEIGGQVFAADCAGCHGLHGEGTGNIPSLKSPAIEAAKDGELFWFITHGSANGMPSWSALSEDRRWDVIAYLKAGLPPIPRNSNSPLMDAGAESAPPPKAPFTDFRFEKPGNVRKIAIDDLPAPFATASAGNGPKLVPRPADVWPQVPAGFKVDLYASGLNGPRLIRVAPNGDYFVAESFAGDIKVFRGITSDSKPEKVEVFASGLNRPYGIAFYPPGPNPKWVYVGDTNEVIRFPYENGDLKARGASEHIVTVPSGGNHWTRSTVFTPDGKKMYVAVGSASN